MGSKNARAPRKSPQRTEAPSHVPLEIQTWHALIVLTALLALFFREILFGTSYFWEDFLYQNYPFRAFAAVSLAAGEIPLWNPYTFNGMPFLADIQTTVLYVPSLILTLFVRGGHLNSVWLELVVVLHFLLAGMSMFFLARSFSLHRGPSLFAGAAYMLSGFMIAHAIHQQIIAVVSWYPLLLLLVRKVLSDSRVGWVFVTGVLLGHSILAGFPQLTLYFYFFLLCYVLFELLTTFRGKDLLSRPAVGSAVRFAAVVLISIAIAAVQLLPTVELSPLSQRAEITYEKSTEGSLGWGQILTFLTPKFFGTSTSQEYLYWGPGPYWHYWETCIYLGVLPLLLGILAFTLLRRNRTVAFFCCTALVAVFFALGKNAFLHSLFFHFVPGFSLFRNPARMGIFIAFAFSILSAFSLDYLLHRERSFPVIRFQRTILLAVAGMAILLWTLTAGGALSGTFPFLRDPRVMATVQGTTGTQLLVVLVSAAVLLAITLNRWTLTLTVPLLLLILLGDAVLFGGKQIGSSTSPEEYFSRPRQIISALRNEGEREIFRINTRTSRAMLFDRNQGMVDRIFTMEGYTPLALQRLYPPVGSLDHLYDLLNVKYKTVVDERGAPTLVRHEGYLPRAFFVYAATVVRTESELLDSLKSPAFNHRTTAILEHDPGITLSPPSPPAGGEARIVRYSNNSIVMEADTPADGLLVLSEMYYPGWSAYVDGNRTEIYRTDYSLRSLVVPRGRHHVEVLYEPGPFRRGAVITLASLLICAGGAVFSFTRSRKTSGKDATP